MIKNIVFLLVLFLLGACSSLSPISTESQLWQAKHISDYSYDISWSCFCDKSLIRAVHIEVKNAKVVSRRYLNGKGEIPQAYYRFFGTIDELIKILKEAEAQNAHKIDIKWNPAYHYPESSHIDYIKDAVDDEQSFTITDFKVK